MLLVIAIVTVLTGAVQCFGSNLLSDFLIGFVIAKGKIITDRKRLMGDKRLLFFFVN